MFDMTKMVKRAYKYRFYSTPEQAAELSRTFEVSSVPSYSFRLGRSQSSSFQPWMRAVPPKGEQKGSR
jgi:hypothetical protein